MEHKNNKHQMKRILLNILRDDFYGHYDDNVDEFVRHWNTTKPAYMRLSEDDMSWLYALRPRIVITFKPRKLIVVKE